MLGVLHPPAGDGPAGADAGPPAGQAAPAERVGTASAERVGTVPVERSGTASAGVVRGRTDPVRGRTDPVRVELVECGRFPNGPAVTDGGLHWDFEALWDGIVTGLREAASIASGRGLDVRGIGVDSWAVDHGFLDDDGALLAQPWCYRDARTDAVRERVYERIPFAEHYAVNGLQDLPFTSLFQLVASAAERDGRGQAVPGAADADAAADAERATDWSRAALVLLVPDLITYRLTGRRVAEVTNASTTGLLDARTRTWSDAHVERLVREFPELGDLRSRLPELVEPGTAVGDLRPDLGDETGLGAVPVFAVCSHDTASAVAAAPLPQAAGQREAPGRETPGREAAGQESPGQESPGRETPGREAAGQETTGQREAAAYISSGTWSLVGLELDAPVLTPASREANFTNELGIDGTVRYLRNVMGLWILNECVREWSEADGAPVDLPALLEKAAREPGGRCLIDVDGEEFLAPGGMPGRVRAAIDRRAPQGVADTRPAAARVILDSLAAAYARVVHRAGQLAGVEVTAIHVVGGGSQNDLLNRLTAEAAGLPVHAGPVEATALGNVLVQARAAGALTGSDGGPASRADLRAAVRASTAPRTYEPTPSRGLPA
ncbi:rhamnulokinase [Myceligenerans sp. I2]|uniref:Rhamnulokinase n=2 Tax=Myceligenerans indicum TaxID=2593663 RepID=A0ABS1LQE5_9MICO|nr:rhamnulokinase [Myceligenerans indicum]